MSIRPLRERIQARAHLARTVRGHFDARGFLEVQPSCWEAECVIDPYIDPFPLDGGYLQPSPEAIMKRMLVEGSGSIYSLGPVFRSGELGTHHRPEFTMLEWYEVDADKAAGIATLGRFAESVAGEDCRLITYGDAFERHAGVHPWDDSIETLAQRIDDEPLTRSIGDDRDGLLDVILSKHVQPQLQASTIVYDYPLSQAALADVSQDDARCAGRFEWFCRGVELANGYDELRDSSVLEERSRVANAQRQQTGRPALPHPQRLIDAMRRGLPRSAGVAVGFERLLMVLAGASDIAEVLTTPQDALGG